jgi:ABC-type sugar transport system ATPase subunit
MDEIFRIADTITVLRDGRFVASHPAAELDSARLIQLMVGRDLSSMLAKEPAPPGEVALEVQGLTKAGCFRDIHFAVRRGEVLGIAGLMGAGRTEVVNAIFGLTPADAGEIRVNGRRARIACPADAMAHGIAMVSEDRKKHGLVLKMSVKHNVTLSSLRRCCRGWWIRRRAENAVADEQVRAFGIKTAGRDQRVNLLSGGNQQKVVLAKALLNEPTILILDEPTRGIDIAAKAEVYAIIARLAREGRAIIMVSSELPEVLAMSDRLLVMREGAIAAELNPRRTTSEEILQHAMLH